jgi:membrane protease YdiL (CAAX protease family)
VTAPAERWADARGLVAALVFPTLAAWAYFVGAASADGGPNPLAQGLYAAAKVLQFGLPFAWLLWVAPERLRPAWPAPRGLLLGAAFGLTVVAALAAGYGLILRDMPEMATAGEKLRGKLAELGAATPVRFALLAAFISVPHAFLEEWYWRSYAHAGLRKHLALPLATLISAVGFAAHHAVILDVYFPGRLLAATLPLSAAIAVGGAAWAWLYERSGSLAGPWLSHVIIDAGLMAVGWDLAFRAG